MSYDLILQAQQGAVSESVSSILPRVEEIASQFGGEVVLYENKILRAGDMLGWIRLPDDPTATLTGETVSGLEQLVKLGEVHKFILYDPQRGHIITAQDLPRHSEVGAAEKAARLVETWLDAILSPHGFRQVESIRFSRALPEIFQHLIASLTFPGEGAPGRLDMRAGWTLRAEDSQVKTPEDVTVFTYLKNIQSISGLRNLFLWQDVKELEDVLDHLTPAIEHAVLPWLEARRTLQDLLRFYQENPSPDGCGLYFGHPPNNHWLLAQVYKERGESEAELQELQQFIQEATSGATSPPWLARLAEQATARIAELT